MGDVLAAKRAVLQAAGASFFPTDVGAPAGQGHDRFQSSEVCCWVKAHAPLLSCLPLTWLCHALPAGHAAFPTGAHAARSLSHFPTT